MPLYEKSICDKKTFADNKEGEQIWQKSGLFQFSQKCLSWYPPALSNVKYLVYTVNIVNPGLDKKKRPKSPFSVWIS
jgi:hypothetical protein